MKREARTSTSMAEKISGELCQDLIRLRTRLLVEDIMRRYRCKRVTAFRAVTFARVRVGLERRKESVA